MLAPIALFVYNRPEHTAKTLAALRGNHGAATSDLFVFSDGPANAESASQVKAVRNHVRKVSGFKSVSLIERSENLGLAASIIDGVTKLCSEYGQVVVLEDDLITAPYFLRYMNDALAFYESEERVMHIAGYMFPLDATGLNETFFLRTASCWGWATWKRAWDGFEKDAAKLSRRFDPTMRRAFNLDGACDHWHQVEQNLAGRIDTWAVFWYASVFLRQGLCLHPATSFVQNIGLDGSGVHCQDEDGYWGKLAENRVAYFASDFTESAEALKRLQAFYHSRRVPLWSRIARKLKRTLARSST